MSSRNGRASWRSPLVLVGLGFVALLVTTAILAPLLAPYDPHAITGDSLARPSTQHLLGTNDIGQDILSELVWGSRASLLVAIVASSLSVLVGVLVGAVPALLGGSADALVARVVVIVLALPGLPLLVLVGALAGPSRPALVLVVALIGWAPIARIIRGQTLSLRQRGFVAAVRGFGAGPLYLIRRHIVPALAPLIVVAFVNWAGVAIGLEAGLAFLGLGDPNTVSWGNMLNRALDQRGIYYSALWTWWVLPAGFAITLAVLGFTFIGVGLEPTFNPRWRSGQ